MAPRALVAAALAVQAACFVFAPVPRCTTARAAADDKLPDGDDKPNVARRLWDRVRRKGGDGGGSAEESDSAPPVVSNQETSSLYAELARKREALAEESGETIDDSEIYATIARKGDFPMVAKKLNEALRNRSLTTGNLPPVLAAPDWSEFAPSSGQTPGEVIAGVLRALREGARVASVEETEQNEGVATLLRFLSPASSFGSEPVNDDDFVSFFLDSEYDVLLRWDQMSFKGTINVNVDGNRAYQTVMLLDEDYPGAWVKTKWALSLRDADDCKEICDAADGEGYWLIDNVMVSAR